MPRLYLVGASMGGPLIAKASEHLPNCIGLIFICTVVCNKGEGSFLSDKERYPPIVRWSGGDSQETLDAIPDCTKAVAEWASQLWRDESGAVLNAAFHDGIDFKLGDDLRLCSVIPKSDTLIEPQLQLAFAQLIKAHIFEYEGMSHAGPLLGGIRVADVVRDVIRWILLQ
jgi:pimeloyl-ACP methyl ester carboxylesterase